MSKVKQLLIVLPICIVLAGLAVLLYLLDPEFAPDFYRISSMVLITACAFFITPACLFAVKAAKEYFERATFEESFRNGMHLGLYFGFFGLLILCFLLSPVMGTIWFVQSIGEASSSIKEKKVRSKKSTDVSDIFDL